MLFARIWWAVLLGLGLCQENVSAQGSPAPRARMFQRGVNLGNYLEAPPKQNWGAKYSREDFVHIRAEGFDHVRLPVAWHHYAEAGPEFKLSDEIFGKVDFLVTNALEEKLSVIVNIHHFDSFTSDPQARKEMFFALWRQIAAHYAKMPESVAFELLNEPKDAATTVVMNPIYAEVIKQIRGSNPKRTIFAGPGRWNQATELVNLRLPAEDRNLIVSIHCYEPFHFTHQSASWAGPDVKALKGIVFPGPPKQPFTPPESITLTKGASNWIHRYNSLPTEQNPSSPNAFRKSLEIAKEWSAKNDRPIHVGEFGCYIRADNESRQRFYTEFKKALDEMDFAWALWDWKAGFRYWDDATKKPAAGMREAIFGKKSS